MRLTEEEYAELVARRRIDDNPIAPVVFDSPPADASEKVFMAKVVGYARDRGWWVYHTHRSDRSECGYPDLHMIHIEQSREIYAELKTMTGQPSFAQWWVLMRLQELGHDARLWRPGDWPEIEEALK